MWDLKRSRAIRKSDVNRTDSKLKKILATGRVVVGSAVAGGSNWSSGDNKLERLLAKNENSFTSELCVTFIGGRVVWDSFVIKIKT